MADYLFMATIPSIGKLIRSSRKTEDMWAGSLLVAYLLKLVLIEIKNKHNNKIFFIFPSEIPSVDTSFADISNKLLLKLSNFTKDEISAFAGEIKKILSAELKNLADFALKQCNIDNAYYELAHYQAENTIELFWSCLPLGEDYKKTRQDLESYLGYIKNSFIRKDEKYQGYELIKPKNVTISFDDFQKSEEYEKYCRGAYSCTVCKENTIIGATIDDYKGNKFWNSIWNERPDKFKKGERLCGFCISKRFLKDFLKKQSFPSTSEISAIWFKKHIIDKKEILGKITTIFDNLLGKLPKGSPVPKLKKESSINSEAERLLLIDGEWLIVDIWKNPNNYKELGISDDVAKGIAEGLEELYKEINIRPSETYALLKLDGDNMGQKISGLDKEGHKKLSELQGKFVNSAKEIIIENYGVPIYIGGDDVLALLPTQTALKCAKEIREDYQRHMTDIKTLLTEAHKFTLSGALLIAHHLLPLQYVMDELYSLEREAKEIEDKNSIGIRFIKHSLSSDKAIMKWDKINELGKLLDIPKAFIYQLSSLSDVVEGQNAFDDFHARKAIIKSLLKRKVNANQIESIIDLFLTLDEGLSFKRLASLIKISNMLKGD